MPRRRKPVEEKWIPPKPSKTYAQYLLEDRQRHEAKYGKAPKLMPGMKLHVTKGGNATVMGIPGWKP